MPGWLVVALLAAAPTGAARDRCGRALAFISYVSGDYGSAVGPRGEVLSPEELREQAEFTTEATAELRACGAADLADAAAELLRRIELRSAPAEVIRTAETLAARVGQRFHLARVPPEPPDVARGRVLYRRACAACHGAVGNPPSPEQLPLTTRPTAFALKDDVARLSPQRIFSAATYGVPGTAMPSFGDALPERELWDVAFYALTLARRDERERTRGRDLLRTAPRVPDYLQLAVRSDDQLRAALLRTGLSAADREAVLSALRAALTPRAPAPPPTARR